MSRPPDVTIGLPVYNGARFLDRALDALLALRGPSIEIVIADNASTDRSAEIAEARAARDARIRVLRSETNLGVEANFARVLEGARGRYFMWAACDDWWAPDFASRLVSALDADPSAVVGMTAIERISESGAVLDVVRFSGADDPSSLGAWELTMRLAGGRPYHLFIYGLYRTGFLTRVFTGFAPVVAADRLFLCRVAMAGGFVYVDEVLHRRTVRQAPLGERYGDEMIGRLWQGSWPRLRLALAAGPYLWRSPVLPAGRRAWIAPIVLRFMKAALGHGLVQAGLTKPRTLSSRAW